MGYRKMRGERLRIILFVSGYHVQDQARAALARMGHEVLALPVGLLPGAHRTAAAVQRALLGALVRMRPDFVLTINHIGFDQDGDIGGLLEELRVPVAAWYVDCPFLVHDGVYLPAAGITELFVWERSFLPALRGAGAARVHYLPLACDPESLAGGGQSGVPLGGRALFVGNSMQAPLQAWAERLGEDGVAEATAPLRALRRGGRAAFVPELAPLRPRPDARMTRLAWATYRATAEQRAGALGHLAATAPLTVVGDAGWSHWLPGGGHHRLDAVPYGPQLGALYRDAALTINLTSLQMPTAVNQRAFDVPAAGGCLLSDRQDDLTRLLPADAQATFGCAAELSDRAGYLLRHPDQRAALAARAREAVLARHTYAHRLAEVIARLRAAHGTTSGLAQRPQAGRRAAAGALQHHGDAALSAPPDEESP